MTPLKIYQIGVGSFGRYGFEKLVEMHRNLDEVDVELKGVCEKDFDALEAAEKFARAHGIEIEKFQKIDDLYSAAEGEEGEVMIYDAGSTDTHAEHIFRSMRNDFFHLAEKPPSLTREQHLEEKRLAEEKDVFWKVDFIERESPVVKKTTELLENESIDSIKIFRESSAGTQKMLQPAKRSGVKGGDVLDKMVHEVYVLDFLEATGVMSRLELENARSRYLMPKNPGADRLMTVDGGTSDEINDRTATAQTRAKFNAPGVEIRLHSSWLGLSEEAQEEAERLEEITGYTFFNDSYVEADGNAFRDQEARFFVIEGSRNLAGDMLHGKLFDLDTGDEIETPDLLHDQLYRVIEKAVLQASGREDRDFSDREVDVFMNAVFDARDRAIQNAGEFFEELESSNRKVAEMIVEDTEMEEDRVEEEEVPA